MSDLLPPQITPKTYDKRKSRLKREMFLIMKRYSVHPDFIRLLRYFRKIIQRKKEVIKSLKSQLKCAIKLDVPPEKNSIIKLETNKSLDESTQNTQQSKVGDSGWLVEHTSDQVLVEDVSANGDDNRISLADQVKEAAEAALQQTGMVFDETSGLYYDYKTGYYYNQDLGLYYHSSTGCYYYYSEEQNQFVYHSHADMSQYTAAQEVGQQRRKKRSSKHKQKSPPQNGQSSDSDDSTRKQIKRKKAKVKSADPIVNVLIADEAIQNSDDHEICINKEGIEVEDNLPNNTETPEEKLNIENKDDTLKQSDQELEEGECTSSGNDSEIYDSEETDDSSSMNSDESVAKNYPPSMRIIVQDTMVPTLKNGSLFLLTKDGGTLGREGETHSVIIPDENISRFHCSFIYDESKSTYNVVDLGSRNGTFLNGKRLSVSKQESAKFEVVHGSLIELGSTKLLCHIHAGNDTCGHCEPGLLIAVKEPAAVRVRSTNLKKQHKVELQRLKTKYAKAPKEKTLEETVDQYKDRADDRRKAVGSSHPSEKTEQAGLEMSIAPTNKGFKMLSKMGWASGKGLGKNAQGDTQPVDLVSNTGTLGLGAGGVAAPQVPIAGTATASASALKKSSVWLKTQKRFDAISKPKVFGNDDSEDEQET